MQPRGVQGPVRDRHFPSRAAIEAYGDGGFRFAGMSHRGSILCLPSGIHGWSPATPLDIGVDTLQPVFAEAEDIEVLLIGTGLEIAPPDTALRYALGERGIRFDTMPTGAAARTYNIMLGENRKVAAALLAVA
ncbi:MAG TPA: MTH938/NDUFAF3 family protein [Methylomirabilota bacterium]|nr:MTH938/NDUFAF3 family protein [Methylomirabilota bacterium]